MPATSNPSHRLAICRQKCKSVTATRHGDFCLSLPCLSRDQTASSAQPAPMRLIHRHASNNSATTGRSFMKFVVRIFRESVEKSQVSLNSDKNNGHFTWRPKHIYDNISLDFSDNDKSYRQREAVDNIKTHFMFKTVPTKIVPFVR